MAKLKDILINILKHKNIVIIILIILLISIGIIIANQKPKVVLSSNSSNQKDSFIVDVKGEVKENKKITLYDELYMYEVIIMCGGFTNNAKIDECNLITKINKSCTINIEKEDYIKDNDIKIINYNNSTDIIHIYFKGENVIFIFDSGISIQEISWYTEHIIKDYNNNDIIFSDLYINSSLTKISLNKGTIEDFKTLNGIGDSIAQRIIDYRNQNGPFTKIEEIMNVKGISQTIFNKIKDSICVN